jgi:hypothetical protein
LIPAIESDYKKLRETFKFDSYYAIQILIRRLDVLNIFFWNSKHQNEDIVNESRELFNFGWAPLLKLFLNDHDFCTPGILIQTFQQDNDWADGVILHSGKLAFCRQLLDYENAKLLNFINIRANEFKIQYPIEQLGYEYFERLSVDFFRKEIVERMIKEKKSKLQFKEKKLKSKLKEIIKNPIY